MRRWNHILGRAYAKTYWAIFIIAITAATCVIPFFRARAANPAAGTITPTSAPVTWSGTASGIPPTAGGVENCEEGGQLRQL